MSLLKNVYVFSLAAVLAVCVACAGEEREGNCNDNGDCDQGFYCGPDNYCLCERDDACAEDEYCNPQGYCQKYQGCRNDEDCGENERCQIVESGKGTCLCMNDEACADDEFCNASGICQEKAGCVLDSDCGNPDYWYCRMNAETKIGECFCKSDEACEEAEFCNPHGYCQPNEECTSNDDCPAGTLCDTESGECLCDYEAQTGCKSDEVCNSSGYCQPRPGCYDNSDCEDIPDTYCDITTRTCIEIGTCTSDRQCELGYVCRQNQCVEGCNDDYDCPLTQCCEGNQCVDCECQGDDFCDFAEFCQTGGTCETAYTANTPYCKPCDHTTEQCGETLNRCLIYPYENDAFAAVSDEYCAVDCSANDRCPQGFKCNEIIVIGADDECVDSADCGPNVPCWKSPEEDKGYCPCHDQYNSCPIDMCLMGQCVNKKTPCDTSADCVIECVPETDEGFGGCVLAKNCGLEEGVHCPDPNDWP